MLHGRADDVETVFVQQLTPDSAGLSVVGMMCELLRTDRRKDQPMIGLELSVQGYANVTKADGAPEWLDRVTFIVRIPNS